MDYYPDNTDKPTMGRMALRIAVLYLVVGALWIAVSDTLASALAPNQRVLTCVALYKGWFYVLATALMLYALIRRGMAALRRSEQELARSREAQFRIHAEADEAKREFYRGTIFSVTEGKLNLVSRSEVEAMLSPAASKIALQSREDLSALRAAVAKACDEVGISGERQFAFIGAVGEAAANAVKHAGGGTATIAANGRAKVCVEDNGPGMDALVLPRATLMRRFSTTTSMGLGYSMILESADAIYLATGPEGTAVLLELCAERPHQEISLDDLPDTW